MRVEVPVSPPNPPQESLRLPEPVKDGCAGRAMEVSLAAHGRVADADGRWCTWMYETRNETGMASHYMTLQSRGYRH
jgi:hypothetical protein